jgi:release factor glutamine methyltransferase
VAGARRRLRDAGIPPEEAGLDARLLAEFALGWDAARYLTEGGGVPPAGFAAEYARLVARRAAREPLAYVTGRKEFWNLTFAVSPAVLVPRPETELIVESALERSPADRPCSIADVCTGSGCIAVVLARERPRAAVVATDVSMDALRVAAANASSHGVGARLRLARADLLKGIAGPFDLIVSNPPYVPSFERAALAPEVRDFEPAIALFAGAGGLAVIRRLVDQSVERLARGGHLMFEFGFGQAEAVRVLLSSVRAFAGVELKRDLRGTPRMAVATRA